MRRLQLILTALMGLALSQMAQAAPDTFVQEVSRGGQTITMRLTKQNLRGAHFELWAQNETGAYDVATPVDERSYIGTVDEFPDAIASGILRDDGKFRGVVYFDRGGTWFTLDNAVQYDRGMWQPASFDTPGWTTSPGQAGTTMYGFTVGIDADFDYFNVRSGASVAKAFENIEFSVAATRALYMQNVLTRPYLGRVIIRTSKTQDPADGLGGGNYLDAVRTEWNNNHQDATRDVVAGITAWDVGGGLAWVGVIGTGSAYSVNDSGGDGEFTIIWRHELGHNWGLGHYDGGYPEGGTINSDNQYARMSGPELSKALDHRNGRLWRFTNEGTYTTVNIPPYAAIDSSTFVRGTHSQLPLDVMANDHDANGDTLSIQSFASTSGNGGTISQQGNLLSYIPRGDFLGTDSFTYKIVDSRGQTATGAVVVDVQPGDRLRLYLPLDEIAGKTAKDQSVFRKNGTVFGTDFNAASIAGKYGNAINLDGVDDSVLAEGVKLKSNTVTLTAWIKPGAPFNPWSGIIFDRTSSPTGMNVGPVGDLRYHWNDTQFNWSSGLVPAADTWTFVALVVQPGRATMYMNSGSGFQKKTNIVSHSVATFGNVHVGRDPAQASRYYKGAIDEARIYGAALTETELLSVMNGGKAESPSPFDGATEVGLVDLSWAPSAVAVKYHVYLGTDATAVTSATPASPEYRGEVSEPKVVNPTTYLLAVNYWRVDVETSTGIITGPVWSFTRNSLSKVIIGNHSFEDGSAAAGVPPGWSLAAGSAGNLGVATGGPHGSQFLYIGTGVAIRQDLNYTLTAGETLTLTYQSSRTYPRTIQLLAKEQNGVYRLLAETTEATGGGGWPTITLNHTVTNYAGAQLALRINSANWNEFDNFRLTTVGRAATPSNHAPTWNVDPIVKSGARAGSNYTATLAADAVDEDGNPITFSVISGPAWLTVAVDGTLAGIPDVEDIGRNEWTVRVTDAGEMTADAILEIQVDPANSAPEFASDPLVFPAATALRAYDGHSLATAAMDADGDALTFSKVSGHIWLTVAADGTLSGTPPPGAVGQGPFVVRVTDIWGASTEVELVIAVGESNFLYDMNGATDGSGADAGGTWNGGAQWTTDPNGGSDTFGWMNGATAIFSAGDDALESYTIHNTAARTIGGFVARTGAPLITGSEILPGNPVTAMVVESTALGARIDAPLTGVGGIVKSGPGTLVLGGVNTFTGNVSIMEGVLELAANGKLYNAAYNNTGTITIATGATWRLPDYSYGGIGKQSDYRERRVLDGGTIEVTGNATPSGQDFTVTANGGTFRHANAGQTLTLSGNTNSNILTSGALVFDAIGNISITGASAIVEGPGSVEKTGLGILTLGNGSNSFVGDLTVLEGKLIVSAASVGVNTALGAKSSGRTVRVGSTGSMDWTINNILGGGGMSAASLPTISLNGGTLTTTRFNVVGNLVLAGGTLVNSNATDPVRFDGYQFIGSITANGTDPSAITTTSGRGNHLRGAAVTEFSVTDADGLLDVATILRDGSDNYPGSGSLQKTGLGSLVLSAANTYMGTTTISAGRLNLIGSLAGSTTVGDAGTLAGVGIINAAVNVQSGGTLAPDVDATLTTGALTMEAGSLLVAHGRMTVLGNLNISDAELVVATAAGARTLVTFTGTRTGGFSEVTIPVGWDIEYDDAAKEIRLVELPPAVVGYSAWIDGFATNGQSGFNEDADNDGIANGLEFLFGGNPLVSGDTETPVLAKSAEGGFTYTFRRSAQARGNCIVIAHFSADMVTWPEERQIVIGSESGPGVEINEHVDYDEITIDLPNAMPREFIRLEVRMP